MEPSLVGVHPIAASSFHHPSVRSDVMCFLSHLGRLQLLAWYTDLEWFRAGWSLVCVRSSSSGGDVVLFSSSSLRLVIHHDLAFPVESLRRYFGQLSSTLHHQVPEAEVFPPKLLQTLLLMQHGSRWVCASLSALFTGLLLSNTLTEGGPTGVEQSPNQRHINDLRRKNSTTKDWKVLVAQRCLCRFSKLHKVKEYCT